MHFIIQESFRNFFVTASFLTSMSIITQRLDGNWNRMLVAGVKPAHIMISHLIEGFVVMFVQLVEFTAYTIFFLSPSSTLSSSILIFLLLLLMGLNGLIFGVLISSYASSILSALTLTQVFMYPISFISGK